MLPDIVREAEARTVWRGDPLVSAPLGPQSGGRTPGDGVNALDSTLDQTELQLGLRFGDRTLLRTALTHPSYANEHPAAAPETNERLEFLGDAVLGLVVAETLYARYPEQPEGRLTEWRAQLVMGPTLARVASRLDLGRSLLLGRGEETTGGRERERNLERVYEAVVGALMLDQGLDAARAFIDRTIGPELEELASGSPVLNPKGDLQQVSQGLHGRPEYVTISEEGPEHERRFTVQVRIDDEVVGSGSGASRQLAEKAAALQALDTLRKRALPKSSQNQQARPTEGRDAAQAG
jgi:ribonuclease-3